MPFSGSGWAGGIYSEQIAIWVQEVVFVAIFWLLFGLVAEVGAWDKDSTREAWQPCTPALPTSISEQKI